MISCKLELKRCTMQCILLYSEVSYFIAYVTILKRAELFWDICFTYISQKSHAERDRLPRQFS